MESWKRIGGAVLGGFEGVALYFLYCLLSEGKMETVVTIVCAIFGAIIGALIPFITIIVLVLIFGLLREASNRDNPRKGTYV